MDDAGETRHLAEREGDVPNDGEDVNPHDLHWPGHNFGLSQQAYETIMMWSNKSEAFAGRPESEASRARLRVDADDEFIDPLVLAGYLVAMGGAMAWVADQYLQDPEQGSWLRSAIKLRCEKFDKEVLRASKEAAGAANLPHGGKTSRPEPKGFYGQADDDQDVFDEDAAGSRTKVDLEHTEHVRPAIPGSGEARKEARKFELHQMTSDLLKVYYKEHGKETRFNADSLVNLHTKAGDVLVSGAVLPLPKDILPGAMDKQVDHKFIGAQRANLSFEDKAREKQIRSEQKMFRNIAFRNAVPLHSHLCYMVDFCSADTECELLAMALAQFATGESSIQDVMDAMDKDTLAEVLIGYMKGMLVEIADKSALLVHVLCTKDITLQKESLILNETGEREVVNRVYRNLPKEKQEANVAKDDRELLDIGEKQKAYMAAAVKAAAEAMQSGKRKMDQRTPNSQNVRKTGYPPAAPKKPFRQLRWKNTDASEDAGARGESADAPRGRGYGKGFARGRTPSGRGRGAQYSSRGGFPGKR